MGRKGKKIVVTSAESGEGKSIITRNLALSLAASGKKVLIIDCDLRRPTLHEHFNLENDTGIADVIVENFGYKHAVNKYTEKLHIIVAGKTLINPAELFNIERISPILSLMEEEYELILIDTPPVVSVTDAQLLAAASDGVIMVLSSGETNGKLCQKAVQLLNNVNASIIGVVLNKVTDNSGGYYGKNNHSYYEKERKKKHWRVKNSEA